jgi:hypothetical protein
VVVTAFTAAFAGLALTGWALGALATCWTAFAIAHFVAAFATATPFTRCAAFALHAFGTFCALTTAAITATVAAAITATFTTLTIALAVAAFAGFAVFLVGHGGLGFFGAATEQALEPAKETTAGSGSFHWFCGLGGLGCCGRG